MFAGYGGLGVCFCHVLGNGLSVSVKIWMHCN